MVEVEWGVFSLAIINFEKPMEEFDPDRGRGVRALRTAIAVRDRFGNEAMATYYGAIGNRIFDGLQDYQDDATITGALSDAGLDESVLADALADAGTWEKLLAEHTWLTSSTPQLRRADDPGRRPRRAGHLRAGDLQPARQRRRRGGALAHTAWLTRYENFSELKRDRTVDPDLEAWRARE